MSLPTFSFSTTADDVASVFTNEIRGKNVLLTGTSLNGIGFEAARVIANYANLVIITGYNSERLKLSEDTCKQELPSANIRCLELNLSSLAAVRKAAAEVNAYPEPLHVLIHNAAAAVVPFKLTADKLENQIATDHIGPFLFTKLLAAKLLAAGTPGYVPRVVFVSSESHAYWTGNGNFDGIGHPDPASFEQFEAYFQAKSANILMAIELSKRSQGRINAYSLHPGAVFTNINQKPETIQGLQAYGLLGPDGQPINDNIQWKTIPQGAATTIAAAFDTRLNEVPGAYLCDAMEANKEVAAHSCNSTNGEKLWAITEKIVGESFSF
ncbi:hypothetical protein DFH06DRAFT_1428019 [Mycena polygramma]|nr:hypothetical protein DFH06DRAFT_1428019 [Mycena polygramma]